MQTFETQITSDLSGKITFPLPSFMAGKEVKIIVYCPDDEEEFEELSFYKKSLSSPVFDFLKDSAEDIYTEIDGKKFNYEK